MKPARGPRPLSIKLFALIFLGAALYAYWTGLNNLDLKQMAYAATIPWDGWNRDWTIVTLSAVLSIAFIPVTWIYLFASRLALWMVTGFSLLKLLELPQMVSTYEAVEGAAGWTYFLPSGLIAAALICLFLPGSARWFAHGRAPDVSEFE